MESDKEMTVSDFPWFTAIHNVMRGRAVTNPRNVIDSAIPGPSWVETEVWKKKKSEQECDAGIMTPDPTPTKSRQK